jgi:hypothetical protein
VDINPANATTMQVASANKFDYVTMGHRGGLAHALVGGQESLTTSTIANEEFAIDELMPSHRV